MALLLLASAVVGYVVYQQLQGSDGVKVPDVRGFTEQQAQTQLQDRASRPPSSSKTSKTVTKGLVIDTDPPSRRRQADKGSKVTHHRRRRGPKSVTCRTCAGNR